MATVLVLVFGLIFQLLVGVGLVFVWRQVRDRETAVRLYFKSKFVFNFLYYFPPIAAFFTAVKVLTIVRSLLEIALR